MGEFLICREYTKTPTSVPNVNFKYGIVHIGKDGVMTLKNTKTNIPQSIQIKKVEIILYLLIAPPAILPKVVV